MFFPYVYLSPTCLVAQFLDSFLVPCLLPDLFLIFYSYPRFSTVELMPVPLGSQRKSDLIWGLLASAASHLITLPFHLSLSLYLML